MAKVRINSLGNGYSYEVIVSGLRDELEGQLVIQAVEGSSYLRSVGRAQSCGNEIIFAVQGESAAKKIKKVIKGAL